MLFRKTRLYNLLAKYKQAYDSYFNYMVQGMVKKQKLEPH